MGSNPKSVYPHVFAIAGFVMERLLKESIRGSTEALVKVYFFDLACASESVNSKISESRVLASSVKWLKS